MKCPRCSNTDQHFFYKGSKGWLCRKCIKFKRVLIKENLSVCDNDEIHDNASEYLYPFKLTKMQTMISKKCSENILYSDVFIEAVCGAGKTELVVKSISDALGHKKRVAFAIARRQVVLEIKKRMELIFKSAKVVAVCEGYTKDIFGDLIICTTHQLYRYPNYFDLLIIDEPDAFPFKGNKLLQSIARNSCRAHIIYLTATPDAYLKSRIEEKSISHLLLNRRPHQKDIIVPYKVVGPFFYLVTYLFNWLKNKKLVIVFVPTKKMCNLLSKIINKRSMAIHSDIEGKDEIIRKFKEKKFEVLFSTTLLERGITINDVDVCVFLADHKVFDLASLVQMSGRVGRNFNNPYGKCLFLSNKQSLIVDECIKYCKRMNNEKMSVLS
ncbi:MAG: helicase-related protein [Anaerorhabdus sp.]